MSSQFCDHGISLDEDCQKCREILSQGSVMERYIALQAENTRLLNIIKGCPICSELERNINTKPKDRP